MVNKTAGIAALAIAITLLFSGCGQIVTDAGAADSNSEITGGPGTSKSVGPEASVTPTAAADLLTQIHAEICEEMKAPRSLIFGVGIGWATIDGKVTGFGPSGKESRVVVEVDSTVYDSYAEKWSRLYGDMVYVESVAVLLDEISSYSELVDRNTSLSMKMEYDTYSYGTKKADILVSNHTDSEITFGDIEIYEKLLDGEWHTIYRDYYSDAIAYIAKGNSTVSYEVTMPLYDMDLEAGTYRIIKKIGDDYYSAEFSIE